MFDGGDGQSDVIGAIYDDILNTAYDNLTGFVLAIILMMVAMVVTGLFYKMTFGLLCINVPAFLLNHQAFGDHGYGTTNGQYINHSTAVGQLHEAIVTPLFDPALLISATTFIVAPFIVIGILALFYHLTDRLRPIKMLLQKNGGQQLRDGNYRPPKVGTIGLRILRSIIMVGVGVFLTMVILVIFGILNYLADWIMTRLFIGTIGYLHTNGQISNVQRISEQWFGSSTAAVPNYTPLGIGQGFGSNGVNYPAGFNVSSAFVNLNPFEYCEVTIASLLGFQMSIIGGGFPFVGSSLLFTYFIFNFWYIGDLIVAYSFFVSFILIALTILFVRLFSPLILRTVVIAAAVLIILVAVIFAAFDEGVALMNLYAISFKGIFYGFFFLMLIYGCVLLMVGAGGIMAQITFGLPVNNLATNNLHNIVQTIHNNSHQATADQSSAGDLLPAAENDITYVLFINGGFLSSILLIIVSVSVFIFGDFFRRKFIEERWLHLRNDSGLTFGDTAKQYFGKVRQIVYRSSPVGFAATTVGRQLNLNGNLASDSQSNGVLTSFNPIRNVVDRIRSSANQQRLNNPSTTAIAGSIKPPVSFQPQQRIAGSTNLQAVVNRSKSTTIPDSQRMIFETMNRN